MRRTDASLLGLATVAAAAVLACDWGASLSKAPAPSAEASTRDASADGPEPAAPRPVPAESPASPERLRTDVEALAGDELAGRPTPSPELDRAAIYIAQRFAAIGLQPPDAAPKFMQSFVCGRGPEPAANVIGVLAGRDEDLRGQAVLVSAHYDHIGTTSGTDDTIYNGANDNASGVASMLAIAGVLASQPRPPKRSVVFAAFCGEELGLQGSKRYAEHPAWPLESTVAHINLEMLGRATEAPSKVWVTGMELSDLGEMLGAATQRTGVEFVPSSTIGWQEASAFARSDNYSLARAGVVAHTLSAGRIDEFYHSVDDEPSTLDYEAMAPLVVAVAEGVQALANTASTPSYNERAAEAGLTQPSP